ncbi:C4-dicarboxylate ABC transporter permease [Synergistales bacterium]|nr:C4-dicarboxylate ABC transporter permease [Synergistales bacterium]
MSFTRRFSYFTDRLNLFLGFFSGLCVVCGALLIAAEIASRLTFQKSLMVTEEYTGYLMAVSSFLGFGYVEARRGHIRMDLIDMMTSRLPRVTRALRVFCYILALLFSLYITYVGYKLFDQSVEYGSKSMQISETPLAIPQFFVPLGGAALFLQYLSNLLTYCAGESER